ncbi:hypothetical protein ACIOHE_06225 [Streptomyces sp. NPDC087851]|uniref:hypothetical protein n=1 Tax=Streptomyces sp. NPDC087851 TaxID=3365810 RepID=UPI0038215742
MERPPTSGVGQAGQGSPRECPRPLAGLDLAGLDLAGLDLAGLGRQGAAEVGEGVLSVVMDYVP